MNTCDDAGFPGGLMNLILWRHAEAEDGPVDQKRALTGRGRKQAERMARWLRSHLPEHYEVLASPAVRTCQTADALGVDYRTDRRLLPGADVADYLAAIEWPEGSAKARGTLVVVGHQPTLGRLAALLLSDHEHEWSIRKGAIWWLSTRERESAEELVLRAVVGPDMV
jgi:phosphohistidine phosphatase